MFLQVGDSGYSDLLAHWVAENFPRRFNYQRYFWITEGSQAEGNLAFRRQGLLPTFDHTEHTDRPALARATPLDDTPVNPFG